nr:putative PaaI family thioesterase [uncultured bacterium]
MFKKMSFMQGERGLAMQDDDLLDAGFEAFPRGLGFADTIAPLFIKSEKTAIVLALKVEQKHLNGINICHGGVLMLLADICCAWNVRAQLPEAVASPTLALSFDFMSAAKQGDWLETRLELLEVKRKVGFAGGTIVCGRKNCVRFNGTFYIPEAGSFKIRQDIAEQYRVKRDPE